MQQNEIKNENKSKVNETKIQLSGICSNGKSCFSLSANTASAVSTCHHPPTVVNSQPAMHPGVGVMSQAKSMFSVSEDGVPETRTDWKVSLRKNEDRYIIIKFLTV